MQDRIENKLHEIANVLFNDMGNGILNGEGPGLYVGHMGILIFCKHYLRCYPDGAKEDILDNYVEAFIETLTFGVESLTYCSGLSGVLEGLSYLNNNGLLAVDYSDVEDNYKKHLQQFALTNILHGYYDYMHGGLGVVKYFNNDFRFLNQVLDVLFQTAEKEEHIYKWRSPLGVTNKYGYNIALSHGMSSIISILCTLNHPEVDRIKRNDIIIKTCNYILSQEIDPNKCGCYFPSQSLANDPGQAITRSRMGWCYGDLSIATSLWQAGKVLHNKSWMNKALVILKFAARRRNFQDCGIFDAGLCHGSASICMMFYYMFLETSDLLFKETCDYWLDCTLKIGSTDSGLAGYQAWHGEKQVWVNEYGMLEGIAGIGLMLLALRDDAHRDEAKWMNFFLLN